MEEKGIKMEEDYLLNIFLGESKFTLYPRRIYLLSLTKWSACDEDPM